MVSSREGRTMSDKMLKFVNTDKEMPAKRAAGDRIVDFDEIYRRTGLQLSWNRQSTSRKVSGSNQDGSSLRGPHRD